MTTISVCDTCNYTDDEKLFGTKTGGQLMAEQVERLAKDTDIEVRRVSCLMACQHHCTVAVQDDDKISYVLGKFDPTAESAEAVMEYVGEYEKTETGKVEYKDWPESIKGHFIARVPSLK